jgi:hypothetical protein
MTDDFLREQFPLSPLDDHLVHQTPDPMRVVHTTDPRFYDRHWNVLHDQSGDLMIVTGGSFYPNLDTAEAYAIVTYKGVQRSVRAFRPMGGDRMELGNGPIRPTILSGLREWRYELDENDWDISYDLHWRDTHRQVYRASYSSLEHAVPRGGQRHVTAGFESFGVFEGWVRVGDERVEIGSAAGRGTRDRHWGIGRGVGGPRYQPDGRAPKAGWIGGNWIVFKDFAIWGNIVLFRYGDPRPGYGKVRNVNRRLRFEDNTNIFLEGFIDYVLSTGETKTIHFERLGYQTAYMKCGLYGGTPDKQIYQGTFVDAPRVEGDYYDLSTPEVRKLLCGLNEHHCRISCDGEVTTGILQPLEPDAYEACLRGDKGWSFLG